MSEPENSLAHLNLGQIALDGLQFLVGYVITNDGPLADEGRALLENIASQQLFLIARIAQQGGPEANIAKTLMSYSHFVLQNQIGNENQSDYTAAIHPE